MQQNHRTPRQTYRTYSTNSKAEHYRHSLLLIAIVLIFLISLELQLTCRKQHREIVPFHDDSDLFERSSEETSNSGRRISREDGKPLHPLGKSDLVQCDDYESFTMPTGADMGRATSSLNSSSYSELRGLQRSVLHGPSNTFQSPISKISHLPMRS